MAGFNGGADNYVTKPFDMLELTTYVETLLRRPPVSKADMLQDEKLSREFCRQVVAEKNSLLMAEVAFRLRKIRDLEEQEQRPATHVSSAFLVVVEVITEFLEEVLPRIRRSAFY